MKKIFLIIAIIGILVCAAMGIRLELFGDLRILGEFVTTLGVLPVYWLYLGTAKILPAVLIFSDTHVWYHNAIIAIVWIGIYIGVLVGMRAYVRQQADLLINRAWYIYRIKLFTGWQKWCSLCAIIGILLIPYLRLPQWVLLIPGGCFLAICIYSVKCAGVKAVFPILQQIYLSALTLVYFILFSPAILALYVIVMVLLVVGVTVKDSFSPKIVTTSYFDSEGRYLYSERER